MHEVLYLKENRQYYFSNSCLANLIDKNYPLEPSTSSRKTISIQFSCISYWLINCLAEVSGYSNNKPHPQHVQLHLASELSATIPTSASAEGLLLFFYSALCSQNLDTHSQFGCHSLPSGRQVSLSSTLSRDSIVVLYSYLWLSYCICFLLSDSAELALKAAGAALRWHLSCVSFFFL